MRDTKLSNSPPGRPLWPAGGLSASAKLAVGGILWLVFSLAVSCWVQRRLEGPTAKPRVVSAAIAPGVVSSGAAASGVTPFDKAVVLNTLDAMLARLLPLALPQARWQRVFPHSDRQGEAPQASTSLAASHLGAADPNVQDVRHFSVTGPCAPLRLGLALLEGLRAQTATLQSAGARVFVRWTAQGTLEVLLNDLVYYVVSFPGREGQLADLAQPLPPAALALVIDDMGQKLEAAEDIASLPYPVAMSIWPRAPFARETSDIAASRRLDSLMHQPMEALPRTSHGRPDPGPGALLTNMSAREIQKIFEENLLVLPMAIGFNNHMGSAFTGDISLCRIVCGMLEGRGLAVLDSVTRPDPQLVVAAREAGLVALARDVFLDTRRNPAVILSALDAAAARARAHGMAVTIGHPYPETLRALRDWQDKEGVAVVPLRRILWKLAQDGAAVAARPYSANINMEKE